MACPPSLRHLRLIHYPKFDILRSCSLGRHACAYRCACRLASNWSRSLEISSYEHWGICRSACRVKATAER
jgi:hypothetical protein